MEVPSPFPRLIYVGGEDGEKTAFFSINQIGDQKDIIKTTPPELRGKKIIRSCYGWLILLDLDEEEEYNWYSLWNPLTLESICLPALHLKPEQDLRDCILTSPPGIDDSMLLFFEKRVPSFIFCRIGDEHWTHHPIMEAFRETDRDSLTNFVVCNGTLYCNTFIWGRLVRIDMSMPDQHLALELLDVYRPPVQEKVSHYFKYMLELESSGELYTIWLGKGGPHWKQLLALEVFRMDFSCMEWKKVESFNDLALFVDQKSSFFWPAIGSGIKGNHIYFTSPEDRSLYSFKMEDKTLSVSLPCPNLSMSSFIPTWVMPHLGNDNIEESKNDLNDRRKRRKIMSENGDVVKCAPVTKEEAVGDHFSKLYLDIVYAIGRCLILGDYMSFRAVNKIFRMTAPPIQWKAAALKGFEDYDNLTPWLASLMKGDAIFHLVDPFRGEKYFINISNNQSKDTKMCYSRDGWCVMLQGERSIFLWNPLVEETIPLPDLLPDFLDGWKCVLGCSFSSSKDWVVLIRNDYQIDFIFLEEGEWYSFETGTYLRPLMSWVTNPVFYNGGFYFFCMEGNLGVIKCHEDEDSFFEILDQPKSPCSSDESFLLECDGMLLSVLVGFLGEWVRVFKLDFSEMAWVEIENLGKNIIFVSRLSCFSMTAPSPRMENRVYFARFYNNNKNVVYYSLITRKLHCHGTEEVLENFYNTKEQLYSTWIEPKWF